MSEYGCCTLSSCHWQEIDVYPIACKELKKSCDDCPFYDKDFFKEGGEIHK